MVQVVAGFSRTNRWLLYTSCMLAPAQFASGIGNNWPTNIGFLAYNLYTQVAWHAAVKDKSLHALCLLVPHFTTIWAITYLGGVSSGNVISGTILGAGTAAVLILNNVSSWLSFLTNQPDGFGEYQFFFYGWRTLSHGWHKFFFVWQISDTLEAAVAVFFAIALGIGIPADEKVKKKVPWWSTYPLILVGAAVVMLGLWTLILWTELIVNRNGIESDTDWIAVWLFVAQVGTMLVPPFSKIFKCCGFDD